MEHLPTFADLWKAGLPGLIAAIVAIRLYWSL